MKVKLKDVCERASSALMQKDVKFGEGDFPIYGAAGYIGNINSYHQENPYVAVVKDGAGIGRTMLLPAKSSVIGTLQYLLPKADVLPEYLNYAVQYMHLEKYYTGATIPHIYFRNYQNEEFNMGTLEEQSRIVNILNNVTQIIDARKRQLLELDHIVKSRFFEMFGDSVNCIDYPVEPLAKLADIVSGITKGRKTKESYLQEVPYMAVSNVKAGYIDWTMVKTIMATENEINQYRLLPKDILMTEGGDPDKLGRGALLTEVPENCIHQNHIFRVRFKDAVNPIYFEAYLQEGRAKQYFLRCAKQTTGIASINMTQLRGLPVVVPPIDLQNQFAAFIKEVDKSKVVSVYCLNCLQVVRKNGIMNLSR